MDTRQGQERYEALRRRYPEMCYRGYRYEMTEEGLKMEFEFEMGEHQFHPHSMIEARYFLQQKVEDRTINQLVFNIGMAELVSYWKCACPKVVRVECGELTEEQVAFWRKLYWNGLGEFFYTNGIDTTMEEFIQIEVRKPTVSFIKSEIGGNPDARHETYLVPIGGGKDSVVTLEVLRKNGKEVRPLIMNPRGATIECARVAGFAMDEVIVIRRAIDPLLLKLNAEGYLNGHTPFSAMLACYTLLVAEWSGIYNIALSNESSANESTVVGSTVNHQYSKSVEFENDFREYVSFTYDRPYNYFSFLRPLTELQIAQLFSQERQYHEVFRSCNVGSKTDVWCGHCAKCLFAYIILSPFIEPQRLNEIFGKSMLDDVSLQTEFDQLTGRAATKPFECVGTIDEVEQAIAMTVARWYGEKRPRLLEGYTLAPARPIAPPIKLGNLTDEEFDLLRKACTESNN